MLVLVHFSKGRFLRRRRAWLQKGWGLLNVIPDVVDDAVPRQAQQDEEVGGGVEKDVHRQEDAEVHPHHEQNDHVPELPPPHQEANGLGKEADQQKQGPVVVVLQNHFLQDRGLEGPEFGEGVDLALADPHQEVSAVGPRDAGPNELADGRGRVAESNAEVEEAEGKAASVLLASEGQQGEPEPEYAHADEVGPV